MDEIKLLDGTRLPIEDGASLGHIEIIVPNDPEAVAVCEKLTQANVSHVEFLHEGMLNGSFDHVVIVDIPSRTTLEDETVLVTFGLREKTELEQRVDVHDDEITELQEAIAEEV